MEAGSLRPSHQTDNVPPVSFQNPVPFHSQENHMQRPDGRAPNIMRPVNIKKNVNRHAEGSVLIQVGNTHVMCTASVEEKVPPFLRGKGKGWVTAG